MAGPVAGELGVLYSLTPYPLFFALLAGLSLANGLLIFGARDRLARGASAGGESEPLRRQAQPGSAAPQEQERGVELGYGTRADESEPATSSTKRPPGVAAAVAESCSQS